ncbi:MAG TPA: sigma 54-interacting transcriptional regulator [Polyangiaceae bacterium]
MAELDSTASAIPHGAQNGDDTVLGIAWVYPEPKFVVLAGGPLTFGRSDDSSVRLEGEQVSRLHATARQQGRDWVLADEASKNGVFIDGARVTQGRLWPECVVRLGDWVGVVVEVDREVREGEPLVRELASGVYGGPTLAKTFAALTAAASSNLSLVLVGETGTGKEVFARALHQASRRTGKLVAVNCAALPRELAESELFGHNKGAFTGADNSHPGYLREADGGTLFLDEILDLDKLVQAKLLRVLEERAVVPLGSTRPQPVDLRVLAATQRSLHDAVELGLFRADLMARLSGLELRLPPLRARREEVVELFRVVLQAELGRRAPGLSPELCERLCLHDWPLNVREVVQVARRACVLHAGVPRLTVEHLPSHLSGARTDSRAETAAPESADPLGRAARSLATRRDKDSRELETLISVLGELNGNVNQAAKRLGISRQRVYRLLDLRPDLDVQRLRQSEPGEPE